MEDLPRMNTDEHRWEISKLFAEINVHRPFDSGYFQKYYKLNLRLDFLTNHRIEKKTLPIRVHLCSSVVISYYLLLLLRIV